MGSPQKSSSDLSLIPEENAKMNPATSKSCESLYSNSSKGSANIIYRQKTNVGVNNKADCFRATRQPTIIPATNEVRQRVLSARRLRMKTYQNQLADAQQTIAELAHENRILRTLHKRQDSALSKYESNNAELPQLLHSHAEELRVWQSKYRNLQAVNKELEQKLKQKEALILSLSDQNKYYIQLNKDKNLEDRQRLTEKLNVLETRLQEKDNDIKLMARKMQLESKQSKLQLQVEQKRNKELLVKLEKVRLELSGYRKLEDFQLQEKFNMNLKRSKNINNDSPKSEKEIDKYSLANIIEAEIGQEKEAPTSERSTHSYNEMVQRTTRSIKNTATKTLSTLSSSTIVLQQTPASKTIAILRRVDQGDGDACSTLDGCKINNNSLNTSSSLMQRQYLNLASSVPQNQDEEFQHDYEDEEYENEVDEQKKTIEREENLTGNQADETDEDDVGSVEGLNDGADDSVIYNEHDYFPGSKKNDNFNRGKKTRVKEEISNIRKQITDDFKEREAFLDTFCRQTTNEVLLNESELKRTSKTAERSVANNHKHKLLAALKAIDDNKSQD